MPWSKETRCWRCREAKVKCFGVTCPACRAILYAAYDAARAANGGRLLYLPEDWDGPALPVAHDLAECGECHRSFERKAKLGRQPNVIRCPECQHDAYRTNARAAQHQRRGRTPRPKDPWAIDVTTV